MSEARRRKLAANPARTQPLSRSEAITSAMAIYAATEVHPLAELLPMLAPEVLQHEENGHAQAVTLTTAVTTLPIRIRCEVCGNRFAAQRRSAKTCSGACRQRLSRGLRARTPPLPIGPFELIIADPPWDFKTFSEKGQGRSPSAHYATMDVDSLCRLPVASIAAPNSGLAMWVYGPRLPDALKVMERWGFTFNSDLLTWIKMTKTGKTAFGTGYTTRKNTEMMIYGKRGSGLHIFDHSVRQSLFAERRQHSRKPDEAFEALEKLFGPVSRIELFARQRRAGWAAWGNELGRVVS